MVEAGRAVYVFDLDDTLYLERDFARSGFAAADRRLRERHGIEGLAGHCEALLAAGARGTIFNEALQAMGCPASEDLVAELVETYRSHDPAISLAPDAEACLGRLSGRLALITDGPVATQQAKIAALGLRRLFDKMITTGSWSGDYGKPHPRAYREIMEWSAMPAGHHVYIADNAAKDFVAPRALGWRTVQIVRPYRIHAGSPPTPGHAAHCVVESLDEIPRCLERIEPAVAG